MASQTIQLLDSWFFPQQFTSTRSFIYWEAPKGQRPAIISGLQGASPSFFKRFGIQSNNQTRLNFEPSQTTTDSSGADLSNEFEQNGSVSLTFSNTTVSVLMGNADTTEPYFWTPSNGRALRQLAVTAASSGSGNRSATLVLSDGAPDDINMAFGGDIIVGGAYGDTEIVGAAYGDTVIF